MTTTTQRNDLVTGKTLARIGLGLLLLGIVFLYRWGIEQGLITPGARIGVGVALSSAMLTIGWTTRPRQATFGALLQGGGVAGLFVSAFAAHAVYDLTSPTAVFVQLVFVSALAIGLAIRQEIESLAVVGVLGGLIAPMMVPGTIDLFPGDAGYVAIVVLTAGALLYRYDWTVLYGVAIAAIAATIVLELFGVVGEWDFTGPEALVAYAAVLLALWGAPLLRVISRHPQNAVVAMVATVTIPLASYFGTLAAWDDASKLVAGLAAATLAVAMVAVHLGLRDREPFVAILHLIPASVFSVTAVALIFDGPSLVLAFAAQGVGFILIGRRQGFMPMEALGWVIYSTLAMFVSISIVIEPSTGAPGLNGEALARLGVIALAGVVAISLNRSDGADKVLASYLLGFTHIAFLAWGMSELGRTAIGQPAVSVLWGTYALIIIGWAWRRDTVVRNVGLATLLATVVKMFLIDLDQASGGAKILLLMGFGLILLALGYLMPSETPEPTPEGEAVLRT